MSGQEDANDSQVSIGELWASGTTQLESLSPRSFEAEFACASQDALNDSSTSERLLATVDSPSPYVEAEGGDSHEDGDSSSGTDTDDEPLAKIARVRKQVLPSAGLQTAKKQKKATSPRAPTAYALFVRENQPAIKSQNGSARPPEILRILRGMWKGMDAKQRKPYVEASKIAKLEHKARVELALTVNKEDDRNQQVEVPDSSLVEVSPSLPEADLSAPTAQPPEESMSGKFTAAADGSSESVEAHGASPSSKGAAHAATASSLQNTVSLSNASRSILKEPGITGSPAVPPHVGEPVASMVKHPATQAKTSMKAASKPSYVSTASGPYSRPIPPRTANPSQFLAPPEASEDARAKAVKPAELAGNASRERRVFVMSESNGLSKMQRAAARVEGSLLQQKAMPQKPPSQKASHTCEQELLTKPEDAAASLRASRVSAALAAMGQAENSMFADSAAQLPDAAGVGTLGSAQTAADSGQGKNAMAVRSAQTVRPATLSNGAAADQQLSSNVEMAEWKGNSSRDWYAAEGLNHQEAYFVKLSMQATAQALVKSCHCCGVKEGSPIPSQSGQVNDRSALGAQTGTPAPWKHENYCTSECLIKHCRDVFNAWVAKQRQSTN